MRRNWIKLYVDQTLRGSCFCELLPDERFVWIGFLLLAGDNTIEGKICITNKMGYTNEQLSELLKCEPELIDRAIKKMVKFDKIKVKKSNVISIVNWSKYQSEYQRQKQYRVTKGSNSKLHTKVTTESTTKGNDIERDREREGDIEEEREKKEINKESPEYRLSELLLNKIKENNPNYKNPNLSIWSTFIDKMIRIDKRDPVEVKKVIEWCQADSFWYKNILSTEKLRKQYDQLVMNMEDLVDTDGENSDAAKSAKKCYAGCYGNCGAERSNPGKPSCEWCFGNLK